MNITERHMDFLKEAKIVFKDQPHLTTWRDTDNTMIALLHSWEDQESQDITIIEIGETVARFEGCLKKEVSLSIEELNYKNETEDLIKKWREDYNLSSSVSQYNGVDYEVELRLYVPPSIVSLFR